LRCAFLRWLNKRAIATPCCPTWTAELAALEARRDKTRLLKQAMMQELLTGKTLLVPPGDRPCLRQPRSERETQNRVVPCSPIQSRRITLATATSAT
jgi:hypothetical protein